MRTTAGRGATAAEHQRGEETRRSGTYHDGPDLRRGDGVGQGIELRLVDAHPAVMAAPQHLLLVPDLRRQRVDQGQLLPGVHRPPQHPEGENIPRRHAQQLRRPGPQGVLLLIGIQFDLIQPQHIGTSFKKS